MNNIFQNKRYEDDGVSVIEMNALQVITGKSVAAKYCDGTYTFETVESCPICNSSEVIQISNKDRYGLPMPVVSCCDCGLLRTSPRLSAAAYSDFYANEYRSLYVGREQATAAFFQEQYEHGKKIIDFLSPVMTKPISELFVLEIGTGAGGILKAFVDLGASALGCDLGEVYLAYGRDTHGLDLRVGTIDDLNLDQKPDVVLYSHVLEHILDPLDEMERLHEMVAEDTLVYIEVPGVRNIVNCYQHDFLKYLQNAHTYHFTRDSLKNLMTIAGYTCLKADEWVHSVFKLSTSALGPGEIVPDVVLDFLVKTESGRIRYERHRKFKLRLKQVRHWFYRIVGKSSSADKKRASVF